MWNRKKFHYYVKLCLMVFKSLIIRTNSVRNCSIFLSPTGIYDYFNNVKRLKFCRKMMYSGKFNHQLHKLRLPRQTLCFIKATHFSGEITKEKCNYIDVFCVLLNTA